MLIVEVKALVRERGVKFAYKRVSYEVECNFKSLKYGHFGLVVRLLLLFHSFFSRFVIATWWV